MRWYRHASFPHSVSRKSDDKSAGTSGYSRIFDLAHMMFQSLGLKVLSVDSEVAKYAFSDDAKHVLRLSWNGNSDPGFDGISLEIIEHHADKFLHGFGPQEQTRYTVVTDSLHAIAPSDLNTKCYEAYKELRERSGIGLDPASRWSMAVRFLPSP
jgi:hypothetical protein